MGPTTDRLDDYRRKRDADRTPEPFTSGAAGAGGIFVVQKHAASRLHYDLRLEHDGVLLSWAVPAGPSLDPAVKRFAAHTEDHPLEYAEFEGVIPAGEYGGGAMIVWDRGSLTFDEDPDEGIAKGKLLFSLAGYKLSGQWTLVRMKKDPTEWLLIKKPDAWAADEDAKFDERSILSGMTVDEVAHAKERSEALIESAELAGAIVGTVDAMAMGLMLASTADAAFSDPDWLFEIKYDGYRMILDKADRRVRLRYRSGLDASAVFPEIVSAARRLPVDTVTLDGEVVVLDELGKPSFASLQRRGALTNRFEVASVAARSPATFFAFDIVAVGDLDTRPVALVERKELVRAITPSLGPIRYADHVSGLGEAMFAEVSRMGLEGIIAKHSSSTYSAGRSDAWRKVRVEQNGRFAVVGYTVPRGTRSGLGALHLAVRYGARLMYAGRVGTGFSHATLSELRSLLEPDEVPVPEVEGDLPASSENRWVTPRWMATVRYKEFTEAGSLRHPVFESFEPLDHDSLTAPASDHEPPRPAIVDARTTEPTNTNKVFWPDDGFTKGDLIEYYTAVADHLLPYLRDRPLVLDRFPDGIDGKSFFQKNAPEYVPDWIRTEWIERDDETGNNYFVVEDVEGLRYVANMASIPLHIWASRMRTLDTPDWCILDLDPKTAPFTSVVTVARTIHDLCDDIGLPHVVKTSGKTGLHILIPMGPPLTYDHQRMLGSLIAGVVEGMLPEIATTIRSPSGRGDKVYIDHLQNGRGKLLVAPFSARPVPGATVSTPLRWSEVTPSLDVGRFTMKSVPRRLAAMRIDPFEDLLMAVPDVPSALARLDEILRT
ncbi:MAG TPA: DNA ligase D [Acidimicrobiia bacterium]|nr:DNA ligase D [Acidimicrobiia bacterium]